VKGSRELKIDGFFSTCRATNEDEMCNFYLMYYVEDDEPLEQKVSLRVGFVEDTANFVGKAQVKFHLFINQSNEVDEEVRKFQCEGWKMSEKWLKAEENFLEID
jgi:hypothetical protein